MSCVLGTPKAMIQEDGSSEGRGNPHFNDVNRSCRSEKWNPGACGYNTINNIRNSKPVERRGRKAEGLPSHKSVTTTARLPKMDHD